MTADPLAPLLALPGVAAASDQAREALGRAHRHRANLRRWPVTAAEAALRAARASAVLDGGGLKLDEQLDVSATSDPVFAGALRVAQALEGGETTLVGVWQRAPLQALARLHMLAAADRVDEDRLGRPRADPDVGPRLELLGEDRHRRYRCAGPGDRRGRPRRTADPGAVRQRGRCGGAGSGPAGHHRHRAGPARARRTGGQLDAARRRLPRRRHAVSPPGRPTGSPPGWCCVAGPCATGAQEALSIAESLRLIW